MLLISRLQLFETAKATSVPDIVTAADWHLIDNQFVEVLHRQIQANNCDHSVTNSTHRRRPVNTPQHSYYKQGSFITGILRAASAAAAVWNEGNLVAIRILIKDDHQPAIILHLNYSTS